MKVLPLPGGIASLQKCYLPMKCFDELGAHLSKYVLIKLKAEHCIVKLHFTANLHDFYCHINAAVSSCVRSSTSSLFCGELKTSNIFIQDGPFEATTANISIVFESLEKLVAWKKKINSLHVLVDILELYVVSSGLNVFLKDIEDYLNLGISYIAVNGIRGRKNVKEAVFQIVSSTNIIIDSELTEKMIQYKTSADVGGMEQPFKLLSDIINHRRSLRNNFISRNVLLIGPEGCGKRTLVKRVANDCDALVIEINETEIMCPQDGEGRPGEVEANIKCTFELIKCFCEQLTTCDSGNKFSTVEDVNSGSANNSLYPSQIVILLLTNVELMCPNRKQGVGSQTTQFLGAMDSLQHLENLLIFATSSSVDDVDQAIRRPGRLDKEVYIGIPSEVERSEIVKDLLLNSRDVDGMPQGDIVQLARSAAVLTPGRVLSDLRLLCRQVKWMNLQRKHLGSEEWDSQRWLHDFACCAANLPVSSLLDGPGTLINTSNGLTPSGEPTLSSIGGLQEVKERLITSVRQPLLHPEAFWRLGIRPPRGVLLYGPPGCAKTMLARALASTPASSSTPSHTITFLSSSAAELYSPFVGESEKTLVDLFRRARAGSPSIVFIDELDSLFGSRDDMHKGGVQERVLATLLMEMDGVGQRLIAPTATSSDSDADQMMLDNGGEEGNSSLRGLSPVASGAGTKPFSLVTVIAATNRPDLIDDALLRPGRLDQLIYIPPPDEESRFAILSHYTEKMPIEGGDKAPLLRELAKGTELYSGADLKNLCKEAALKAISEEGFEVMEVKKKYFVAVLNSMRSSLTTDMVLFYQDFCNNKF